MTPLDDPQLRDALIAASQDMPHHNLWGRLQEPVREIVAAQPRRSRAHTIFQSLGLLAVTAMVFAMSGTSLFTTGYRRSATATVTVAAATHAAPLGSPAASSSGEVETATFIRFNRAQYLLDDHTPYPGEASARPSDAGLPPTSRTWEVGGEMHHEVLAEWRNSLSDRTRPSRVGQPSAASPARRFVTDLIAR